MILTLRAARDCWRQTQNYARRKYFHTPPVQRLAENVVCDIIFVDETIGLFFTVFKSLLFGCKSRMYIKDPDLKTVTAQKFIEYTIFQWK